MQGDDLGLPKASNDSAAAQPGISPIIQAQLAAYADGGRCGTAWTASWWSMGPVAWCGVQRQGYPEILTSNINGEHRSKRVSVVQTLFTSFTG